MTLTDLLQSLKGGFSVDVRRTCHKHDLNFSKSADELSVSNACQVIEYDIIDMSEQFIRPIQWFNQSEVTVLGSLLNQFSCYCCSFSNTQHLKLRTLFKVLFWTDSDVYCCSFMNTLTWLYFPYFINLERPMTRIHLYIFKIILDSRVLRTEVSLQTLVLFE